MDNSQGGNVEQECNSFATRQQLHIGQDYDNIRAGRIQRLGSEKWLSGMTDGLLDTPCHPTAFLIGLSKQLNRLRKRGCLTVRFGAF